MTDLVGTPATAAGDLPEAAARRRASGPDWRWKIAAVVGGLFLIALVRIISGANDITSGGTVGATISLAMPIALAGLGGLWAERSGVVNIGLEGMMIMGTFGAGWAGYQWGMWAGVAFALLFGAIAGGLHAVATVGFGVDHIVSGVAINIIALGAGQSLAGLAFTGKQGGGPTQSPQLEPISTFDIPGVSDAAQSLPDKHWFFVSDLGAVVAGLSTRPTLLTIAGLLPFLLTWFLLWRPTFRLRLRSCGESPEAAESLGVNVLLYKYVAVIVSGALAGLAGAFLVQDSTVYREGQPGGRGYIGLAAMIFGNWRPGGLLAGS